MTDERRRRLIEGLVGDEHRELYLTNVDFHATIDVLAQLIPTWIDATAVECERRQHERDARTEALLKMPPLVSNDPPEHIVETVLRLHDETRP